MSERRLPWAATIGLSWLTMCVGCAPPTSAAAPSPAPELHHPTASAEPALRDRDWAVLRSAAQGLKLALPEARAWLVESNGLAGQAWELRHEPTGSRVSVRRWRASRLPRPAECERELRARVPGIAQPDETSLVAERTVAAPAGFSTHVTVLSLPGRELRLRGQVLAVGAAVGECVAALAQTECGAELELAERLRLLDTAVSRLRATQVEDRVPSAEPPP